MDRHVIDFSFTWKTQWYFVEIQQLHWINQLKMDLTQYCPEYCSILGSIILPEIQQAEKNR